MKDIKEAGKYKHAKIAMGRIISADGSTDLRVYGRSQYRTCYKYTIEFTISQGTYMGTFFTKESGLQNGELVEVRYDIDEDGAHLLNDLSCRKLKEIIVAVMIVIPLCMIFHLRREMNLHNRNQYAISYIKRNSHPQGVDYFWDKKRY